HCRHKIFNARFTIDGVAQSRSMFEMIRHTHAVTPQHTIVAYSDNASVMEGGVIERWLPEGYTNAPRYGARRDEVHVLMKVQTHKVEFPAGSLLIQLGGPGMRIGMGGGAASSMAAGANATALDFDSVQRGNPEIQRRAQEVINHCSALGASNPILAIHDVGAGGISNAFPELVDG